MTAPAAPLACRLDRRLAQAVAFLLVVVAPVVAARAQDANASPPPTAGESRIAPDRPDLTNATHIVSPGTLQFEVGGQRVWASRDSRSFGTPLTLRLGVAPWIELRAGTDGWIGSSGSGTSVTGVGNVQFGAKIRLVGGADDPVLAVLPTVTVPTASAAKGLGSGTSDVTVVVASGFDLGRLAHADVNVGLGWLGSEPGAARFPQQLASVSVSRDVGPRVTPYVEAFWLSRTDPHGAFVSGLDTGITVTVRPHLAFDAGVGVGLSGAAPDRSVFAGVSTVLGRLFSSHPATARHGMTPIGDRPFIG